MYIEPVTHIILLKIEYKLINSIDMDILFC